ncbi:TPA: hypothetical protein PRS74_000869 [Escherichia coli]|nr:hypothetical protein [Escherichia coli]HDK2585180.1 hypothetical protein [Escherichia coli]
MLFLVEKITISLARVVGVFPEIINDEAHGPFSICGVVIVNDESEEKPPSSGLVIKKPHTTSSVMLPTY